MSIFEEHANKNEFLGNPYFKALDKDKLSIESPENPHAYVPMTEETVSLINAYETRTLALVNLIGSLPPHMDVVRRQALQEALERLGLRDRS